jgi:hypothetical protein
MFKYEMGLTAKDKITGFKGVITSRTQFINGCNRYGIEPPMDKDGKLPEAHAFDEARIEVIDGANHSAMAREAATSGEPPGGSRSLAPKE